MEKCKNCAGLGFVHNKGYSNGVPHTWDAGKFKSGKIRACPVCRGKGYIKSDARSRLRRINRDGVWRI